MFSNVNGPKLYTVRQIKMQSRIYNVLKTQRSHPCNLHDEISLQGEARAWVEEEPGGS